MSNTYREQEEEEPLRWEYKVLVPKLGLGGTLNHESYNEELNLLGAQGWELVTETVLHGFSATLKRPIP
jgi:hypothetical protein